MAVLLPSSTSASAAVTQLEANLKQVCLKWLAPYTGMATLKLQSERQCIGIQVAVSKEQGQQWGLETCQAVQKQIFIAELATLL